MQENIIVSVDFGSSKMSASIGRADEKDVDIIGTVSTESKGIVKGFIEDEERCGKSFQEVMKKIEDKTKKIVSDVFVGINARDLKITEISKKIKLKDGKVSSYDIKKAISKAKDSTILLEDEEIVDCIINFYKLDGKVLDGNIIGWHGETVEFNFTMIIGKTSRLDGYRNVVRKSSYNFCGFYINIIAGRNIFLEGKGSLGLKAIVDIGAETIETAVFSNGVIKHISSRPLGGHNITKDLAICGEYSIASAEQIKKIFSKNYETVFKDITLKDDLKIGTNTVSKELFYEVTEARLEELINYVKFDLKNTSFYEGLCSIILYGDGVTYYENIKNIVNKQIYKKCTVATNDYLGMKKTENITSLAGVKEVFNRYSILKEYFNIENNHLKDEINDQNNNYNTKQEEVSEIDEEWEFPSRRSRQEKKGISIIKKLKRLLEGII